MNGKSIVASELLRVLGPITSLMAALIFASCTAGSVAIMSVDLLSFISSESRTADAFIPVGFPLTAYLLPGVHLDVTDEGPDESSRTGLEIEIPEQSLATDLELEVTFVARVVVRNQSSTASVSSSRLDFFLAGQGASDVYAEGSVVASVVLGVIAAGEEDALDVRVTLRPVDSAYAVLVDGSGRIGIRVRLASGVPALVPVRLTVAEVLLETRVRPFGLLD